MDGEVARWGRPGVDAAVRQVWAAGQRAWVAAWAWTIAQASTVETPSAVEMV